MKTIKVNFEELIGRFTVGERLTNSSNQLSSTQENSAIIKAIEYEEPFKGTMELEHVGRDFQLGEVFGCTAFGEGKINSKKVKPKYCKICSECGKASVAYPRKLNQPLINALKRLTQYYAQNRTRAKKKDISGIGHSQYANFNWLGYFGLAHRTQDGWIPTQRGIWFLKGELSIPNFVLVVDGEVVSGEHEAWEFFKDKLKEMRIEELDPNHETEDYWKDFKRTTLFD